MNMEDFDQTYDESEEKKEEILEIPEKPVENKEDEKEQNIVKNIENIEKNDESLKIDKSDIKNAEKWLSELGWSSNPFAFIIKPQLFVGYSRQISEINSFISERHKICLVLGPTGSGKTTFLKYIEKNLPRDFVSVFVSKPPKSESDFVFMFNEKFKRPWFAIMKSNIRNIHEIADFINKKLGKKRLIVFYDEIHESGVDTLEWIRVLSDHTENMYIILAGLPVFEEHLSEKLETLRKRIAVKIILVSLTKEETKELIKKRIISVGGKGTEFSEEVIDLVYEHSGGFPREILRICDMLVNNAIAEGRKGITTDLMKIEKPSKEKTISLDMLQTFTPMQRQVLDMLSRHKMSPGEIADKMELDKYRSRQHAVRSVNNILKRLMQDGLLEREKTEKAFIYKIAPKLKTLFVKA